MNLKEPKIKVAVMVLSHDGADLSRMRAFATCLSYTTNAAFASIHDVEFKFYHFYENICADDIYADHVWHRLSNKMPLGERHNQAIEVMMRYEWDYLMQLGSDDVISATGYTTAAAWMRQGCRWGSFNKVAIVSPCRQRYKLLTMLGNMGAGRFVHRDLITQTLEKGTVWHPEMVKGLDGNSEKNIMKACNQVVFPVVTYAPVVFDFKTSDNLHRYEKFTDKEYDFSLDMIV